MVASLKSLVIPLGPLPTVDTSWLGKLTSSAGDALDKAGQTASIERNVIPAITGQPAQQQPSFLGRLFGGQQQAAAPQASTIPAPAAQSQMAAGSPAPVSPVERGSAQGSTFEPFIDTVKTKVTNPYGLAAVAATGRAESGFDPANAARSWADPSQSGQAGTAGGVMSWRADRLQNLQRFAQAKGEQGNGSPQTQAEFFLNEDPSLIDKLNNARSPQEAQSLMNNAWKFRGYDQPGGESARRQALAQHYAGQFSKQGDTTGSIAPAQVASLDPSIGMPQPAAAAQMRASSPAPNFDPATATPGQLQQALGAPQAPYRDPQVTTAYQQPAAPQQAQPAPQPAMAAPAPQQMAQQQQVAQAAPQPPASNILAAAQPVSRQNISNDQIAAMVRDPNTRAIGLQLWQQVLGKAGGEPWQFVTLPDGTLARANQSTGAVEKVGQFAKPQDPIKVGDGETLLDPVTKQPIYTGQPKTPQSFQEFQLARQNGFTGSYADWEKVKAPGVNVNTTTENSIDKAAGEGLGKVFSGIFDEGQSAKQDKANVGLLRSSLANSPNGILGGIAGLASDYGINVGPGADQVQVAKSIISKMVPAQRVPGSGTTSDRDLAMFQGALPRLNGTPEGNTVILDTLDALADQKTAKADIITRYYAGEIKAGDAVKQLQALPDPYAAYKNFTNSQGGDTGIGGTGKTAPTAPRRAYNPVTKETLELRDGVWQKVN